MRIAKSLTVSAPRFHIYSIYPKYSDRQARANSVDSDQTPRNAASDQGIRYLPIDISIGNEIIFHSDLRTSFVESVYLM